MKSLESWLEALNKAAAEARSGAATPFDSEDEYDEELTNGFPLHNNEGGHYHSTKTSSKTKEAEENYTDSELEELDEAPLEDVIDQVEKKASESSIEETSPSSENSSASGIEEIPTTEENREGLLKLLTKAVGDLSTVTVPVSFNEPVSFLQRMCELTQYCDLLDKANQAETSIEALMYVTTYAISMYQCVVRTWKPFNPYLGETFEFIKEGRGRFISEQVSHHPPVGASYLEGDNYEFWQEQGLKTKFTGNSLACESVGRMNVKLKKTGHMYSWEGIKTVVHNVIIGSIWIDHYGDTEIKNYSTGTSIKIFHSLFLKIQFFSKKK